MHPRAATFAGSTLTFPPGADYDPPVCGSGTPHACTVHFPIRSHMPGTALITGISGQDGSYLAELLLDKGYAVHGMLRSTSGRSLEHIAGIRDRIELHSGDLLDQQSLTDLVARVEPTEVYNLAAQTFVPASWKEPVETGESTALGVARLLEAIRRVDPRIRFFQANSSELFGNALESPQSETTPFRPRSPYGTAKLYAYHITANYRETHKLFALSGILYNHESPRRGAEFVTGKITQTVARIKLGLAQELRLGNLQARRDWGFAGDYVRAMWLALQQTTADDYVIGTGRLHSVEDFVRAAFEHVGLNWGDYVVVDPLFYRPDEPFVLQANAARARQRLGWEPVMPFEALVASMVDADLARLRASQSRVA